MSYFKAKMHPIRFRLGLRLKPAGGAFRAPPAKPAGGAYSAPPNPLAGFKGPTSKGEVAEGSGEEGKGMGGDGMGGREREGG